MDVEGWMRLDNLYQRLFYLVDFYTLRKHDGKRNVIGNVQRMLHTFVIDTQLGVREWSRVWFMVIG